MTKAITRKAVETVRNFYAENPGDCVNSINGVTFRHYGWTYRVMEHIHPDTLERTDCYDVYRITGTMYDTLIGHFAGNII